MSDDNDLSYLAPIEDYERQAAALFDALQAEEDAAVWRFKWEHPSFRGKLPDDVRAATLSLDDARLVVARSYSFEGWADLKAYAEQVANESPVRRFEDAVEAVVDGDVPKLRTMLEVNPNLIRARSSRRHHATLLHYIGANGVEGSRQRTPPNAVEVAKLLLDAGAEVDALADMYDNKCTTMGMLVSSCHPHNAGLQAPLAELLLDYGAAHQGPGTNWQSDVGTALAFGYLDTAKVLAKRAGAVKNIAEAAGLGLAKETARMLPSADATSKHAALALAAQHGHVEVGRLLLDAGEDPSRYNPEGHHSHSTPLHQAVLGGHLDVVKLLIERGAPLDAKDKLYQATPLGWANYGGQTALAEYLKEKGATDG
jgi:ankyrin repeat protein